jgi:hypothetical protein
MSTVCLHVFFKVAVDTQGSASRVHEESKGVASDRSS